MSLQILLALVLCNVIWAANPIAGKLLMQSFSPMHVAWLRYTGALLFFFVLYLFFFFKNTPEKRQKLIPRITSKQLPWIVLLGIVSFFISPFMQYTGLTKATASEFDLLVAAEPLLAVLIARLVLKEKLKFNQYMAFFCALLGFFLLSKIEPHRLQQSFALFNIGNIFILISVASEAAYSITARKLVQNMDALSIFGISICVGWTVLTAYTFLNFGLPDLRILNLKLLSLLFFMGPIGTTATYIYWTVVLKEVSVSAVALTLFIQPIEGVVLGYFFLQEKLSYFQSMGALLILFALCIQTFITRKEPSHG